MTSAPHPGGRFVGREHQFPLRIYFEDTDFSGLVYHANYLRYMERARSDMLKCAGIDQREAFESGEGVYAVSEPLYDAAWELARRGVLRPSPRQSVMQFAAFNATGGGYTLTEAGREWLATTSDAKLRLRDPWGPFERP